MPVSNVEAQEVILVNGDVEHPGIVCQLTISQSPLTGSGGVAAVDVEGTSYTLAITCCETSDVGDLDTSVIGAEVKAALAEV